MIIKYRYTPIPKVDVKLDKDEIVLGFTNENKQNFMQCITSYISNGDKIGQACFSCTKEELKEYIKILNEMYKQM